MKIDPATAARIAELARLETGDAERLIDDFAGILDYVAMLDALDVGQAAPAATEAGDGRRLREDEPAASLGADGALRNAPDPAAGHFRVPRVLEE